MENTNTPQMENLPETRAEILLRRIKQIKRVLSYILLYGCPYFFREFFEIQYQISDYSWFIILFCRTIFIILWINAVVASYRRGDPLNVIINVIAVGWNFKYLTFDCIHCYYSQDPTVFDYFTLLRSTITGGYS